MIRRIHSTALAAMKCWGLTAACALLHPALASANPNAPVIWYDGQMSNGVRCIQQVFVNCAGHDMPIDGTYGPVTRQAVIDIQRLFHLREDGEVGPDTGEAIRFVGGNCMVPEFGSLPYWDVILADQGCNNDVPTHN
jgi:hypothetical protein